MAEEWKWRGADLGLVEPGKVAQRVADFLNKNDLHLATAHTIVYMQDVVVRGPKARIEIAYYSDREIVLDAEELRFEQPAGEVGNA